MGIRDERRQEMMEKILADADRQLIDGGPASLSVREIARSLGVASSAMYRYVASRDELLTLMIVRAYNDLADAVESAHNPIHTSEQQLRTLCHSVRRWAVENPQHYALLYGTPVPGFHAPELTVEPGSRVLLYLGSILDSGCPVSAHFASVATREASDVSPEIVARAALVWSTLLGAISSEIYGYLGPGFAEGTDELFELAVDTIVSI